MRVKLLLTLILLIFSANTANAAPLQVEKQIVLVDTSGSMKGERLLEAQNALLAALRLNDDPKTTLVYSFDEQLKRVDFVGKSDDAIRQQIAVTQGASHTRLYDSINDLLPSASALEFGITIISDGDDSKSLTTLPMLLNSVAESNIKINFVSEFVDPRFMSVTESLTAAYKSKVETPKSSPMPKNQMPYLALLIASSAGLFSFVSLSGVRNWYRSRVKRRQIKTLISSDTPQVSSKAKSDFFARMNLQNRFMESKQRRAFEKELPAALRMLASSLTAGMSFLQALNAFAEDDHGPCAKEFKRALIEIQYGAPVERALEAVANRMNSEDLRWAVSAFALQREVGGSLAAILNSTAQTIESRFELRREVRTLSAEGRVSSYILMALPIGIFTFLSLLRPQYVSIFITEPIGNLLLVLILVFLTLAWFWLKALVRISV